MIEYHKGKAYDIGKLYKLTASYLKSPVYEILTGIHKSGSHPFKSEGGGFYSKAEPVCKTMLGEVKGAPKVTVFDSMQALVVNVTDEFVSNAGCDYRTSFTDCTGDFFENKEIRQESKMKTVTHEGKVYQIGGLYEFSDGCGVWFTGVLVSIDGDSDFPYRSDNRSSYLKIRKIQNPIIGTIEDKLIELESGAPYQFRFGIGEYIGIYSKKDKGFAVVVNLQDYHARIVTWPANKCTDIVKLVPEVK